MTDKQTLHESTKLNQPVKPSFAPVVLPCHSCKLSRSNHETHEDDDDNATVVTSNTSCSSAWASDDSTITSINTTISTVQHGLAALPVTDVTDNYYHALALDKRSIAVDSGASDGFGDVDTPGTDRQPTDYGVTMAGATGDCRTSIATDKFDLPFPPESLKFHVFKRGDIQRPFFLNWHWVVRQ